MLYDDLKKRRMQAMKNKDTETVSLLGTLLAEASKANKEPSDDEVLKTVKKFLQGTEETIEALESRDLDASKQHKEKAVLEEMLPKQMSESEIEEAVEKAIEQTGAQTPKDMGKVMGELKQYGQTLDMKTASAKVKDRLSSS